jgi:hypothetical protein
MYNAGSNCRSKQCEAGVCTSCSNDVKDGDETGVNCGGVLCAQCADGKRCSAATDCASYQCTNGVCTSCFNRVVDGDETGVDPVPRQARRTQCRDTAPSANLFCTSCSDGVKNGVETSIDCDGVDCPGRAETAQNNVCALGSDCVSDQCEGLVCTSCSSAKDAVSAETDRDCGGTLCGKCIVGQDCGADSDCSTDKCDSGTN